MTRAVLVVGDALLDRDLAGTVHRLCPDAPAPVLDHEITTERAGGAGLAASLIAGTGADVEVTLLAAVAPDDEGDRLRRLSGEAAVHLVDIGLAGRTPVKARMMCEGRPLLRLDSGGGDVVGDAAAVRRLADRRWDAVLVADYGNGVAGRPEVRRLLRTATAAGTPVVWDPHRRGGAPVPNVTLVVPNRSEAVAFAAEAQSGDGPSGAVRGPGPVRGLAAEAAAATTLLRRWQAGSVAVTLGERGALVVSGDGVPLVVPVEPVPHADPCGAGDAFAAAATLALAYGAVVSEAVIAGVDGARRFLSTATASRVETSGAGDVGTVVATGGCFDVLHPGHVATLEGARRLGGRLCVLLNSDRSVRRLKGPGRPAQSERDRAAVLMALGCVDEVVVFDEPTPAAALRRLRPDIFVKGGDYASVEVPEMAVMAEWGGSVVALPFVAGRSTTQILERTGGGTGVA